tara:strand:+ start:235 stop:480 length:246 start_codon:yes stop_codon:yes gene_type:complete
MAEQIKKYIHYVPHRATWNILPLEGCYMQELRDHTESEVVLSDGRIKHTISAPKKNTNIERVTCPNCRGYITRYSFQKWYE